MKKIIIIVLLSIAWNTEAFAQNKTAPVPESLPVQNKTSVKQNISNAEFAERFLTTGVIIAEAVILLFILYYWKKTRKDSLGDVNTIFKQNIKAIRSERVKPVFNSESSNKRRKLIKELNINKISGKLITSKAKKLSVSKGEIFLAARIQQISNQVR